MKIPFVPDYYFPDIYAIDPERLRARGVKVLLADLDNTLAPYGVPKPSGEVVAWRARLEQAGITLQQAQRSYDKTVDRQFVHAEVDGTVSSLKVAKGDEVSSGQEVAVIRDSSKMMLSLQFPAADAANFSVGQSADDLAPGEVRIRSAAAGTEIVLRNNGRIDINGLLFINGMPYLGMGG